MLSHSFRGVHGHEETLPKGFYLVDGACIPPLLLRLVVLTVGAYSTSSPTDFISFLAVVAVSSVLALLIVVARVDFVAGYYSHGHYSRHVLAPPLLSCPYLFLPLSLCALAVCVFILFQASVEICRWRALFFTVVVVLTLSSLLFSQYFSTWQPQTRDWLESPIYYLCATYT